MSAVNAAEVQGKLVKLGLRSSAAWDAVLGSVYEIVAFDGRQAELAGNLLPVTSPLGLSLGDRACLALGAVLQLPIYTADQAWKELQLGLDIQIIR
jgi:PIN domain nuclease of toxin-antitoxin system